jgi:divalent metal cation (Fe/Co/Zn/Cd) transporter
MSRNRLEFEFPFGKGRAEGLYGIAALLIVVVAAVLALH